MKVVVVLIVVLVILIGIVLVIGYLLPQNHVASRSIKLKASQSDIWNVITDYRNFPLWRADVKSVEPTTSHSLSGWKEIGSNGAIPFEIVVAEQPNKLVTKIADPHLPFGGTWTYLLQGSDDGTVLTVTENGEVYNPIFRFMSRFVFGHTSTIDQYLKALGEKFGQTI